jgi:hypothetical protein
VYFYTISPSSVPTVVTTVCGIQLQCFWATGDYHEKRGLTLFAAAELVAPAAPDPVVVPFSLGFPAMVGRLVAVGFT